MRFPKRYRSCSREQLLLFFVCSLLLAALCGCEPPYGNSGLGKTGCARCHEVKLDASHSFKCTRCHLGRPKGYLEREAHQGLVARPAGPECSGIFCGGCHAGQEASARSAIHYTLKKEIGVTWQAFFPQDSPPEISGIKAAEKPGDRRSLLMDALARRCLRCHVYYQGDSYMKTRRGTGCAACHMNTRTRGHLIFKRPEEKNCLACHYSNFTGWDYEGRFEKDYPEDFRAPLQKGRHIPRPYGLEWISMQPDVHRKAGMTCLDCHGRQPFHGKHEKGGMKRRASCVRCHVLDVRIIGHRPRDLPRAACETCHAVWSVLDLGRNLMRQDAPDLEDWKFLKVQGSSEIEAAIDKWADSETDPPAVSLTMTDKINGMRFPGLWFAGLEQRRWAPVVLGTNKKGMLSVIRPLLDLSISYVDSQGDVPFDSMTPDTAGSGAPSAVTKIIYPPLIQITPLPKPRLWLPYHPHTLGKADYSRTRAVQKFLTSGSP